MAIKRDTPEKKRAKREDQLAEYASFLRTPDITDLAEFGYDYEEIWQDYQEYLNIKKEAVL